MYDMADKKTTDSSPIPDACPEKHAPTAGLGSTFDAWSASRGVRPHQLPAARAAYRAVFLGPTDPDCPADRPNPIVRETRDGELIKFVQRAHDGLETESVIIPMGGGNRSWKTVCVSSQVGCARGCVFCETAQLGLLRNLSVPEIVGQIVAARRFLGADVRNVVFMGMGEPMDNFDSVVQAVRVLNDTVGFSIARGRITISTVGRTDGIRRLAALGWRRINLAVSLNAPNDEIRSQIMPINRTDNMAALREAMLAFPGRRGAAIMVEYVLIPGVNDATEHARELAAYIRPVRCSVNVIPYNPRKDSPWPAPTEDSVASFMQILQSEGIFCKRRVTKGRDLMAACGQLGNRAFARPSVRPIRLDARLTAATSSPSR